MVALMTVKSDNVSLTERFCVERVGGEMDENKV